jgi:hypothetical protein
VQSEFFVALKCTALKQAGVVGIDVSFIWCSILCLERCDGCGSSCPLRPRGGASLLAQRQGCDLATCRLKHRHVLRCASFCRRATAVSAVAMQSGPFKCRRASALGPFKCRRASAPGPFKCRRASAPGPFKCRRASAPGPGKCGRSECTPQR